MDNPNLKLRFLRHPKAFVHGSLAGHYRRGWFTVRGWSNRSWSHVALALRVPPGATGATAPLRRELVRWAGWAVWRLPHWHWDMVQLGAEKIYKCSSLIPKLFATPIAANPKAQRMLSSRLDRFQASKSYAWKNIPSKFVRLWKLEVALPSNCEMTSHHWLPLSRKVLNSPDISDISHHFSEENAIVKTTCVIDAVQAATYLGKAVVNIYRAEICPDDEPLGCTGSYELNAGDLILNLFDLHNYI